jgi:hypothetical protein
MFELIQVDGVDLICYDNGDIWKWFRNCKWKKYESNDPHYYRIRINSQRYSIHRLMMKAFKKFDLNSELVVDHRNGNIHDNRLENLFVVTSQQNSWNRKDVKGYSKRIYIKSDGTESITWRVNFMVNKERIRPTFDTEQEAIDGYTELKRIHHII